MIITDVSNIGKWSKNLIEVKCDNCLLTKEIQYRLYTEYGYSNKEYLCRKCKTKRNNLNKYGVENVFQTEEVKSKIKKTNIEKYGVEYITQSGDIKEKIKNTNIEKYGVDHHMKNHESLNKQKQTNLERYGVANVSKLDSVKRIKSMSCVFNSSDFQNKMKLNRIEKYNVPYIFQSEEIKKKIKISNLLKYGVENPASSDEIKNKIKDSVIRKLHSKMLNDNKNIINIDANNRIFKIKCLHCDNIYDIGYFLFYKRRETKSDICTICNPIDRHRSGKEISIYNFIKENYKDQIINNYKLKNIEIDIYLPLLKLGFEFNGIYWHSEIFKEKNYHVNKTNTCLDNDIRLIHIWEDDWTYNNDLIKSMILNQLKITKNKIYARKCDVREISDNHIIKDFLNANHILGNSLSSIKIGLYNNNNLVSLMTFKKCGDDYELNRFCSLINHNIIGAASKLLKYFIKRYSDNIITFSDRSYSSGITYEKIGFFKIKDLSPDYYYVQNDVRIHKFNFRNKDVKDLYRIYDCGKFKYRYRNKNSI